MQLASIRGLRFMISTLTVLLIYMVVLRVVDFHLLLFVLRFRACLRSFASALIASSPCPDR